MTILDSNTWTLADRLRKSRMLADMDQVQMAAALGVARTTVSNWERGTNEPPASSFIKWAQLTGVSLDWLSASYQGLPQSAAMSRPQSANYRSEG